ncbi:type I-U CRISPR-associated protein Cas5/Cas6 [Methylacidiphilum caldifontis]|uniref:type I-G CRISPR-associated protein Csb2 n=2 Tax=cellular organisms TaxID=131567 RepID=UPI001A8DDA5F|nr:type I-U CRISPR-associated protein Csb2 [Methylacidiphilum caldifontis]QSR88747.1 type I-U CRISPR-associated protein Cas5/Cas6 [Methylacidiphilum caldifontis]
MTLVLEIEYLMGVCFAAVSPDSPKPDWPPQPDRVFSALTAAWAARGEDPKEAEALRWLEKLPPPGIIASESKNRSAPTVFVPANDASFKVKKHANHVLPATRNRNERFFPAALPANPVVRYYWPEILPTENTLAMLNGIAQDTAYVGHSSSLTRCRFFLVDCSIPKDMKSPNRRVYPGRFDELVQRFQNELRPNPGDLFQSSPSPEECRVTSLFDSRWLILEHVDGQMPDIRACAILAKALRDTLLSGYRRIGLGQSIPELISGHDASGRPTRLHHLAIIPLPFVGFPYADGTLLGLALTPPRTSALLDDENFLIVLRSLAPFDSSFRRILTLVTKIGTPSDRAFSISLSPSFEPPSSKRSLDPLLYTRPAKLFGTVTPIVLDRHLKKKGEDRIDEINEQVVRACDDIGLPAPVEVVSHNYSAIRGTPPAYPPKGSPTWLRWMLPASLASRSLTHAVIRFSQPIEGPVILGAGRFVGFGLCRPI